MNPDKKLFKMAFINYICENQRDLREKYKEVPLYSEG